MAIDTTVLNIDFEVLGGSTNCKALKVVDLSNWAAALGNASFIDIITPGGTLAISMPFQKQVVNIYNTNNLNLSDVQDYSSLGNLPDGLYQITVKVCLGTDDEDQPIYKSTSKYWLQDCMLRCKVAKKIIEVDLTCDACRKNWLNDVLEVQLFLDAAQAQIENCNANKAMEYYRRAAQQLEQLKEPNKDRRYSTDDCPECWPGRLGYRNL